jgi:hypothetical protein
VRSVRLFQRDKLFRSHQLIFRDWHGLTFVHFASRTRTARTSALPRSILGKAF